MRRMSRESSVTTTRPRRGVVVVTGVTWLGGDRGGGDGLVDGGAGAGEQALGVEEHDQPVLDLGDRVDRVAAGGRHVLELVARDGDDLVDLVDDDADLAGA